jgi:DNA repair protein RadD
MKLRDYQVDAVNAGVQYFQSGQNEKKLKAAGGLMVLPTGSGKSLVIAGIAAQLDEPTLVFQPTKEILEQNYKKFLYYGNTASIYSASMGCKEISKLTFATIGSVKNHVDKFKHFRNIIIDECHFVNAKGGMYRDFLAALGVDRILGLTATPYRLTTDGFGGSILKFLTRTRPRVFSKMIHLTQNAELFDRGYLALLKYQSVNGFDSDQVRLNSTGADYDDKSVRNYYRQIGFDHKLAGTVRMCLDSGRKNILVFTRFIEESESLVASLDGQAEIVTGQTKKREREQIIKRFRSGETSVVANVGVLTVGFDYPELETIVMARPTMSLALYYQMIGRGIRVHPNKDHTWVVDLCDNYGKFGKVEDLKIASNKSSLWYVESQGRQLTNVYYGERCFR